MRSPKPLIVLAAVLAGLAAYWYFIDAERPLSGGETRDRVFDVEAEAIRSLRILSAEDGTSALVRENDAWRLTEPVAVKADESEVSSLTRNLATLEIQRVVVEDPESLEPYGLTEPRVVVTFTIEGSDEERQLALGARTPTGGDLYARRNGEPQVFLISSYLESTFDRSPFELRDKSLLVFERDKVDRLEIMRGQTRLEAVKSGLDWRLSAPVKARADYSAIEGLISRLQSAQMLSVASEEAAELGKYGLTRPGTVVTLGMGSSRASLALGSATPGEDIYVRDMARDTIMTAPRSLLDEVQKEASDLRRKDVFEFRPFNAGRLEITRGDDVQVFAKKAAEDDDEATWGRTAPTEGDVDTGRMDSLLTRLSGLRAQSFRDSAPKGSTVLTVDARFDEGKKQEHVRFVRSGADIFALREDEPGAALIDASDFDEAAAALDALQTDVQPET